MTQRASKKQPSRKIAKTESKYYIVNSMKKLTQQMAEFALKYNEKLVMPSLEAGKETLELMREDPKKAFARIKDDGRELAENIRTNVDRKVHDWVADGKNLVKELADNPHGVVSDYLKESRRWTDGTWREARCVVENLVKDGKTMVTDVRSNPREKGEELIQVGKKCVEALPGMEKIEKTVEKTVQRLAGSLNLPSQNDLKELADTLKKLDKKVDKLSERLQG